MIWVIRLYLLIMAFVYAVIGVWALLDPLLGALELGYPSFLTIIGLSITDPLGYSEIAGLYGGLNLCIGILCLIGIFKKQIVRLKYLDEHYITNDIKITVATIIIK